MPVENSEAKKSPIKLELSLQTAVYQRREKVKTILDFSKNKQMHFKSLGTESSDYSRRGNKTECHTMTIQNAYVHGNI